jgi:hypothetical protein
MRLASPRLRFSDSGVPGRASFGIGPDILASEAKTWPRRWNGADAGTTVGQLPSRRARVKLAAESRLRTRNLCCMFCLGGPVSTVYANSRRFVQNGFSEKFEGYSWNIPFNIWRA